MSLRRLLGRAPLVLIARLQSWSARTGEAQIVEEDRAAAVEIRRDQADLDRVPTTLGGVAQAGRRCQAVSSSVRTADWPEPTVFTPESSFSCDPDGGSRGLAPDPSAGRVGRGGTETVTQTGSTLLIPAGRGCRRRAREP